MYHQLKSNEYILTLKQLALFFRDFVIKYSSLYIHYICTIWDKNGPI